MPEHELEKLLGGFAADTLTPEERQKLFTAALQDQQLFNALADEQSLKELLTDPAVRRRLLHTLNRTSTSGAGDSLSWLDWLRRPATLAYAGGLAVTVFAVILGTKVYQESLRQAAQPATEELKPVMPSAPAPPASQPAQAPRTDTELKEKTEGPPTAPGKQDGFSDKLTKREKAAAPPSQEQHPSSARDDERLRSEQDAVTKQAPVTAFGKSAEDVTASASKQEGNAPPSAAAPESTTRQANVREQAASARALFYAEGSARSDIGTMAQEREARKSSAEPAPEVNRPERKPDRFALTGKAADVSAQVKPLGLRYSFVVQEADGRDREVDATIAAKSPEPVYLTVESNQEAYLQIWKQAATPQLLFPQKETGQISLKIAGGQRQRLPWPRESGTIAIRLSRIPFGPVSRQEAVMLGRLSTNQIQETITTGMPTSQQEQATYIVNQDPSPTAQIAAEVRIDR